MVRPMEMIKSKAPNGIKIELTVWYNSGLFNPERLNRLPRRRLHKDTRINASEANFLS